MRKPVVLLLALLAPVVGCGCGVSTRGAESTVSTVQRTATKVSLPGAVRLADRAPGALIIDGATNGSLTALATHAYQAAGGGATVSIRNRGVSAGFSELCEGQIDIADSSRPMSSAELAQCARMGVRPVQLEVASDALVLATKTETDVGADCLTVAQVKSIVRAGSPVYNWGQLGFDQVPLSVAGPGPGADAFGFVGEDVLGSGQQSLLDFRFDYRAEPTAEAVRQFVTGSTSDAADASRLTRLRQRIHTLSAIFAGAQKTLTGANLAVREAAFQVAKGVADQRPLATQTLDATDLAQAQAKRNRAQSAVAGQTVALAAAQRQVSAGRAARRRLAAHVGRLGLFGFSYYVDFEQSLRPLEISASAGRENCIFPSQQTVTTAAYPLSRRLLITTSVQDARRTDVREFLVSYLHNAQRLAAEQGLVELPDDVLTREQAFFGAGEQPGAGSSSAASVSDTAGAAAGDLPPTVH